MPSRTARYQTGRRDWLPNGHGTSNALLNDLFGDHDDQTKYTHDQQGGEADNSPKSKDHNFLNVWEFINLCVKLTQDGLWYATAGLEI